MRSLKVEFDYFSRKLEYLLKQCIEVALSGKLEHFEVLNTGAHYDFPAHLLSDGVGGCLQSSAISNCYITTPLGFCKFRSLQNLSLFKCPLHNDRERNKIGQQRFELLLHTCPSLEILSIEYSTILSLLTIRAPNQLKELTINYCTTDGIQIIHAPKLEKLECLIKRPYYGSEWCKLSMATVPSLKHFQLGFEYYPYYGMSSYPLEKLSESAPHLETLILCFQNKLNRASCWRDSSMPSDFSHDRLRVLIIKGYQGEYMEFEINLILFMLNRATRLERVFISFDVTQSEQWVITEKIKIVERLGGGVNSNVLISFI